MKETLQTISVLMFCTMAIVFLILMIKRAIDDLRKLNKLQSRLDELSKEIAQKEAEVKFYDSLIKYHTKN